MTVVGASDITGHAAQWSQGTSSSSLLAPGSGIICASNLNESFQTAYGTAYSASLVGGLAAYLMSHPYYANYITPTAPDKINQIPFRVDSLIRRLAWPSYPGGPDLAFNGMDWYIDGAGADCNPNRRKRSCREPSLFQLLEYEVELLFSLAKSIHSPRTCGKCSYRPIYGALGDITKRVRH